ncbi:MULTISPECIES: ABC transporter ATP-binding protein [Microbacterium]|uniref:ABC transporter ATP-binding protein n=1 Tax=Microbacterium maritypicum MF109 TaxID=1333857 RepID=T5KC62_MICMQ|nr:MULTISPECIES: ABC transporter ATP-binding protein [Microbacterium]EQM73177.1 ABC transporter ATP-binding protein [Microbacterium maritypicum MF109]NIG65359.1 ATP-binding cassette domain-containing protein [Microbacterium sp. Be9]
MTDVNDTARDSADPLISVTGLSVSYDVARTGKKLIAIEDVDLDVFEGEFITVLGPSGCGKTTFMNVIAGLVAPSTGAVLVDGKQVDGPGPDRAVVFQDYALLPWRTVFDNVKFGLEMQKGLRTADWRAKVQEAIEMVGLAGFESSYPRELSGGMQQRVGLARAFVAEPRILLMDEPLGAVDALTREVMRDEIEKLIEATGKTVLFITHSIEEAILLGDRIVVFKSHPGAIKEIITTGIPRPRSERSVQHDPRFLELRDHLWEALEGEATAAAVSK